MKTVTHQDLDLRCLAMHGLIRDRLLENPVGVISRALKTLKRWKNQGITCSVNDEWERLLLTKNAEHIAGLLSDPGEHAIRLRHCSPFTGILSDSERMTIIRKYAA